MRFTKQHALKEIMEYPKMKEYLDIFFSSYLLDMIPKSMYDAALEGVDQVAITPWGEPFFVITDQLLTAANFVLDMIEEKKKECILLWEGRKQSSVPRTSDVFLIAPTQGTKESRPAVIICPGGGYTDVSFSNEGTPIMQRMEEDGYCAFMLKYSVAPARYPKPQMDLMLAIKYVRANAKKYGVAPDNILIMGSSAGGHLCASTAALYQVIEDELQRELTIIDKDMAKKYENISAMPNKIALSYSVISFEKEQHEGSFQALTGGDEMLRHKLSVEHLVTEDYPKTFLWTCEDDDIVPPSNTIKMMEALKSKGVTYEGHTYPTGGHGCGLAYTKSASKWSQSLIDFMK